MLPYWQQWRAPYNITIRIQCHKLEKNQKGTCSLLEVFRKSPAKITLAMEDGEVASDRGSVSPADEL